MRTKVFIFISSCRNKPGVTKTNKCHTRKIAATILPKNKDNNIYVETSSVILVYIKYTDPSLKKDKKGFINKNKINSL